MGLQLKRLLGIGLISDIIDQIIRFNEDASNISIDA